MTHENEQGDCRQCLLLHESQGLEHHLEEDSVTELDETEDWIRNKIRLLARNINVPENQMPRCTDEELWRSDPKFKYYTDPAKAKQPGARSTKNFDNRAEAHQYKANKGGVGVVVEIPGEVKACGYCAAFDACEQRKEYFND